MIGIEKFRKGQWTEYYVYKIENDLGQHYIGITHDFNFRKRGYEKCYLSRFNNQPKLKYSILSRGWENHKIYIVEEYKGEYTTLEFQAAEDRWILKEYIKNPSMCLNVVIPGYGRVYNDVPMLKADETLIKDSNNLWVIEKIKK